MQLQVPLIIGRVVQGLELAADAFDSLKDLIGLLCVQIVLARRMPTFFSLFPLRFDPASLPHKHAEGEPPGYAIVVFAGHIALRRRPPMTGERRAVRRRPLPVSCQY